MELEIEVVSGVEAGRIFSLTGPGPFFAGTSPECDILIRDPSLSPVHGTFQATGEGFLYIDNGSEQGSFRESEKIDRAMLTGSARLRLGEVEIGVYVVPANGQRQEERIVFCDNCQKIFPLNEALQMGQNLGEPAVCGTCFEGTQPGPDRVPGFALGEAVDRTPFAITYAATDTVNKQEVLLDIFSVGGVSTRQALLRINSDIEKLKALEHPAVYQPGEIRTAGDYFIRVHEKPKGRTLADIFNAAPKTPKPETDDPADMPNPEMTGSGFNFVQAVALVRILANVMDAAHDQNILHRDMRPQNIILSPQGDVWLDGLALARHFQLAGGRSSERPMLVTAPAYQSPELLRDPHNAGPRSDIYSLGAITYQLMTGKPAFAGEDMELLLETIRIEPPPPVQSAAEELSLPDMLDSVFSLVMAKLPKDRYETARDFAEALAQAFGFPPEA
ncbi:MAG: protein kinase domain-containing protein [Planctomycetota bacterium]|jgi:hypothetical protein